MLYYGVTEKSLKKRGNPNMVKGGPSINPKGGPRGLSAFQMQLREDHDPAEMSAIVKAIYKGEPFVRVLDTATGLPRLASAPIRAEDGSPGYDRPKPATLLREGERVCEVVYPTAAEQMAAMKFVAEYAGWKPAGEVNMNVSHSTTLQEADLENLSDEDLDNYLNIIETLQVAKARNASVENDSFSAGSHILDVESTVNDPSEE